MRNDDSSNLFWVQMQMKFKSLEKELNWLREIFRWKQHKVVKIFINYVEKHAEKLWIDKTIGGGKLVNLTPKNNEEQWAKNNCVTFNCTASSQKFNKVNWEKLAQLLFTSS